MRLGINPKVDYAFKKLFGSEENKILFIGLLKAILRQDIVDVEILNPFSDKDSLSEKLAVLDIKARFRDGRLINIEMQMAVPSHYPNRALFYWAKTYHQQLHEGELHHKLRATISIHILNEIVFPQLTEYHLKYRLAEVDHPEVVLTNHIEIHLIELPKFLLLAEQLKEPLERWCYFLIHGEELEPRALPETLQEPEIEKAMEVLEIMNHNDRERLFYEGRLREWRDRMTTELVKTEEAQKKGEEIGIRKGLLEGIELGLELKFGVESLVVMETLRSITDLSRLRKIKQLLRDSNTIADFRDRLPNSEW